MFSVGTCLGLKEKEYGHAMGWEKETPDSNIENTETK